MLGNQQSNKNIKKQQKKSQISIQQHYQSILKLKSTINLPKKHQKLQKSNIINHHDKSILAKGLKLPTFEHNRKSYIKHSQAVNHHKNKQKQTKIKKQNTFLIQKIIKYREKSTNTSHESSYYTNLRNQSIRRRQHKDKENQINNLRILRKIQAQKSQYSLTNSRVVTVNRGQKQNYEGLQLHVNSLHTENIRSLNSSLQKLGIRL